MQPIARSFALYGIAAIAVAELREALEASGNGVPVRNILIPSCLKLCVLCVFARA